MYRNSRKRDLRVSETAKPDGYVALATYLCGSDAARLLSVAPREGEPSKIVLFDTVAIAREFIPILGLGRSHTWSADGETIFWMPLSPTGFNRADILTGYDPYNLPAQMPEGIRSETHGKEWRSHIMFSAAFFDVGQHVMKNGVLVNSALEKV